MGSETFGEIPEQIDLQKWEYIVTILQDSFFEIIRKDMDVLTLDFSKGNGLIPVIAQDYQTGEVLMLAFMNEEAWKKTQETGLAHYYSRTRKTLWKKGGSSGHIQKIKEILVDCDNDTLLLKVEQVGAACHKGYRSCFYRKLENNTLKVIREKVFNPEVVYKK